MSIYQFGNSYIHENGTPATDAEVAAFYQERAERKEAQEKANKEHETRELKNIVVDVIYSKNYQGGYYFEKKSKRKFHKALLKEVKEMENGEEIRVTRGAVSRNFLNFCVSP